MEVVTSHHSVYSADDREGRAMKLSRYRRPPLNHLLGFTVVKRWVKGELGISQVEA